MLWASAMKWLSFKSMQNIYPTHVSIKRCDELISSDAHSSNRRPPVLSQAVEAASEILGSYEQAEYMVTNVPASILSGNMLEIPEPTTAK